MKVIYCAAGNKRFAATALEHGLSYGAQLPATIYFDPCFVDQNFRAPNLEKYRQAVSETRPELATVLDWENHVPLAEVLTWAEEIAPYVQTIIITPKVMGGIPLIPHSVAGKPVRLGYSVPTSFAGTELPLWEFEGRPVHLLGGSPMKQWELSHYMKVESVDGNYAQKMAVRYCQWFSVKPYRNAVNKHWPQLQESEDGYISHDAPYEAFSRSCENIMQLWSQNK